MTRYATFGYCNMFATEQLNDPRQSRGAYFCEPLKGAGQEPPEGS